MSWLGLVAIALGLYLAFKVAGMLVKLVLWVVIVAVGYWWLAPWFGWPPLVDLVFGMGA